MNRTHGLLRSRISQLWNVNSSGLVGRFRSSFASILQERFWTRLFLLLSAAIIVALFILKIAVVLGFFLPAGRSTWWGIHEFSDILSMIGGHRFASEGFFHHFLLMNTTVGPAEIARGWQYYQVPQLVPNSAIYYTHYGSLDALIVGIFNAVGISSLRSMYLLFACISFASLALWTAALFLRFGSIVALVSVALITPSVFFFTVAESPSAESLSWSLTFLTVAAMVFADRLKCTERQRQLLYAAVWVFSFLQANNNPQFIPFIGIFITAYAMLYWEWSWRSFALYAVLASGIFIGYLVHFLLVIWALGGWNNFVADMVAALQRRTHDFSQGIEVQYRQFDLWKVPAYLNGFLLEMQGLRPLRWVAMVVLPPLFVVLSWNAASKSRLRDWALGVAMLFGGFFFVAVFVEAAVTQPLDILKTLFPGASVLFGLCVRECLEIFRRRNFVVATVSALVVAFVVLRVLHLNFTGYPVLRALGGSAIVGQTPHYLGAWPDEIQRVGRFLREKTAYGDVVFAGFQTGSTGHPDYPNPAWEHYADRQVRVFDNLENWERQIADLDRRIQAQPDASPIKKVQVYALVDDDVGASIAVAQYLENTSKAVGRLEPDKPGGKGYTLYLINRQGAGSSGRVVNPGPGPSPATPWTDILTIKTPVEEIDTAIFKGGWKFRTLPTPSVLHTERSGLLHLHSVTGRPLNGGNGSTRFNHTVGSTLEGRFLVSRMRHRDPNTSIFALLDGRYELKATLSVNSITFNDQNTPFGTFGLPPATEFVTLRMAIVDGLAYIYLNGQAIVSGHQMKPSTTPGNAILIGDYSQDAFASAHFDVDYLAYSRNGAFAPDGKDIKGDIVYETDAATPWTVVARSRHLLLWDPKSVSIADGVLRMTSSLDGDASRIERQVPDLANTTGSTFEAQLLIRAAAIQDPRGAIMSLGDGTRELSIGFFQDRISVYDGPNETSRIASVGPGTEIQSYRLAIKGDCGYVFIGGQAAFAGPLRSQTALKGVRFGDFMRSGRRNFDASLGSIAVSSRGAFQPDGKPIGETVSATSCTLAATP